jgi:MFS transporter, Spinster family, sphingosine-1-phosphate transporter
MIPSKQRWSVVIIFFIFMLLHQIDRLLINPMAASIMKDFNITYTQLGAIFTGALVVGAVFYPLWGYLNDHYSRAKLLALASFIWGSTTWLNAIAPTYRAFFVTRASTGIDDSSYPGLYSIIADYFPPTTRGKIYGVLQLTQPLGYLIGMVLALTLGGVIGWRNIFILTGSLGIVLSFVIFFGVKDVKRGQSEPELVNVKTEKYKFSWKIAGDLFKKPTLILMFLQGFFGVFPWNVITSFIFLYLIQERNYQESSILFTMAPAILIMAAGYPLGGAIGDTLFKRTPRGRLIICTFGVLAGAVLLTITLNIPLADQLLFGIMLAATALFIPFASANVVSTVYDVTVPEVRSTAFAIQSFIESIGSALAPLIAGIIADAFSLKVSILWICAGTWLLCSIFFALATILVPKDIKFLRNQFRDRATADLLVKG